MNFHSARPMFALTACACVFVLTGCGESTGSVKGKVYLQDKLVTAGSIAFLPPNEKVATTEIRPDGTYELPRVSTGLAKISVTAPMQITMPAGKTMMAGKMGAADKTKEAEGPKGAVVPIPEKYADAQKSGLEYTVKSGSQEFDIKLP